MITSNFLKAVLIGMCLSTGSFADDKTSIPKSLTIGNVTYLTGGIGEEESSAIKEASKNYLLELVFVQKLKEVESYLSDVKVSILDAEKNSVLEVVTDGPFLLVNLPSGAYVVNAEFKGISKKQKVNIVTNQHKKLVFWWPNLDKSEIKVNDLE
ncbi:MAG: carboxypeptidase-like regulatory domain-containing protein [Pseudomonadota bacterium]